MKPPKDEIYTNEFYVAGVRFRKNWKDNLSKIEEGDLLNLVAEPTNPYDPNAVQVFHNEVLLGYVPKKFSAEVASYLPNMKATAVEVSPDFEPWTALKVLVEEAS